MNHMSVYLKNKTLNENLQGSYIALFNEDIEVDKASYKRQASVFVAAIEGQTSNNADILFPIAAESWGAITHIGIYDSLSGGNLLFKSQAESIKTIDISSQYKIPKNYLIVRLR